MLLFRPLIIFLLLLKDSLMLRTLVAKLLGLLLLRVIRRWDSEYAELSCSAPPPPPVS